MKYLYYYSNFSNNEVFRNEIVKETDCYVFIKNSIGNEIKISKKTYRIGNVYNSTHYYQETSELLEKFNKSKLKRLFIKKLKELEKCTDEIIMQKVIDITKD